MAFLLQIFFSFSASWDRFPLRSAVRREGDGWRGRKREKREMTRYITLLSPHVGLFLSCLSPLFSANNVKFCGFVNCFLFHVWVSLSNYNTQFYIISLHPGFPLTNTAGSCLLCETSASCLARFKILRLACNSNRWIYKLNVWQTEKNALVITFTRKAFVSCQASEMKLIFFLTAAFVFHPPSVIFRGYVTLRAHFRPRANLSLIRFFPENFPNYPVKRFLAVHEKRSR